MRVLDLFAGTGSSTEAFADAGHQVITVEMDPSFPATITADIMELEADDLKGYGPFDFIWASPPCTAFSVASISYHWEIIDGKHIPKTAAAVYSQEVVAHTLKLINELQPRYWMMENPRGKLRKLDVVANLPRTTVTYCQYGDDRMKPTDLWGHFPPSWEPKSCSNGDTCHVSAPRGSQTGTQGLKGAKLRSRVPYGLSQSLLEAMGG